MPTTPTPRGAAVPFDYKFGASGINGVVGTVRADDRPLSNNALRIPLSRQSSSEVFRDIYRGRGRRSPFVRRRISLFSRSVPTITFIRRVRLFLTVSSSDIVLLLSDSKTRASFTHRGRYTFNRLVPFEALVSCRRRHWPFLSRRLLFIATILSHSAFGVSYRVFVLLRISITTGVSVRFPASLHCALTRRYVLPPNACPRTNSHPAWSGCNPLGRGKNHTTDETLRLRPCS